MSEDVRLDEVTPTGSPTEDTSKGPDEWGSLDGRSQDRFQKMIALKNQALREAQEAKQELERVRSSAPGFVPMPAKPATADASEDERLAASRLQELGFLTKDELAKEREKIRSEIQAERDRELLDRKHESLKEKYSKNGYPAYDEQEVEAFMQREGIYNPDVAYRELYRQEVIQIEANKIAGDGRDANRPLRTKPKSGGEDVWTPERLQERLRQPDGKEFYLKNVDKINALHTAWNKG